MGERGYDGASMRDMAARAGVSVAALYYHFPSKHEMLREFLDAAWRISNDRLDRRLQRAPESPRIRLDAIVATIIESHRRSPFSQLASAVAFREHTRLNPPERAAIEQQHRRMIAMTEEVVRAGIASGDFSTDEPRQAARAILAMTMWLASADAGEGRSMDEMIVQAQRFALGLARS
jgi:AcrR family transcriptional regulator